jgi:hypothetical protein
MANTETPCCDRQASFILTGNFLVGQKILIAIATWRIPGFSYQAGGKGIEVSDDLRNV